MRRNQPWQRPGRGAGRHDAWGTTCCCGSVHESRSEDLPGFGLRCRAGGAKSWVVQCRTKPNGEFKQTLGTLKGIPFAKAFRGAERLIAAAKLGQDPAGDLRTARKDIPC